VGEFVTGEVRGAMNEALPNPVKGPPGKIVTRRKFLRVGAETAAGGALLGVSGLVAACGGTSSQPPTGKASSAPKKVQFPFYSGENDPETIAIVNRAIAEFEQQHPGVTVQQVVQQGGESANQQIEAGFHAGQDMGVMVLDPSLVVDLITGGYLYPLDSVIRAVGTDQFPPGSRIKLRGHDWAYPHVGGPYMLWYRTDLVRSAPGSVEELKRAASANRHGDTYGIVLPLGQANAFTDCFPGFIWSLGGDYYDPTGKCIFGSDHVRAAIENYVSLLKTAAPGNTTYQPQSMIDAYFSGRAAMAMYAGRLGTNMAKQAPTLMSRSAVAGGATFGPVNIHFIRWDYLAVDKRTANPELAMEFIKTLMTGQVAVDYSNTVPGQLVSANKSVRAAAAKNPAPLVSQHPAWFRAIDGVIERSASVFGPIGMLATGEYKPYNGPPAPWAGAAWGSNAIDMQMMQKIVLGGMSVKDGQAWATEQFSSVAKAYIQKHPKWLQGEF
jgi:multiple sugar transport system substrate-binding protein